MNSEFYMFIRATVKEIFDPKVKKMDEFEERLKNSKYTSMFFVDVELTESTKSTNSDTESTKSTESTIDLDIKSVSTKKLFDVESVLKINNDDDDTFSCISNMTEIITKKNNFAIYQYFYKKHKPIIENIFLTDSEFKKLSKTERSKVVKTKISELYKQLSKKEKDILKFEIE